MIQMKVENIEAVYELSPMQQGMLFHTLYDAHAGVYFDQVSCSLHGDLNVAAFARAWQHVLDRHPILRTAFYWEELDKPLQVVHRSVRLPCEQHDTGALSPAEQDAQLAAFLKQDRTHGFDLSTPPLMRLSLFRVNSDMYQFVWSFHHLLLDGWSLPLVLQEVFACYAAFAQGRQVQLDRPRPYRDYIAWLQQQDLAGAEAFWRTLLKDFRTPTALDIGRSLVQATDAPRDAEQEHQLDDSTTAVLQAFARQHRLTLNTLVQGAWALLLSRYSGETDIVFGAVVSGRPPDLAGVERMIGLFINTVPVRVHVRPASALSAWLGQIQAQQMEARQYEYSPLAQVQRWSDVPGGMPLFESIMVFDNYPLAPAVSTPGDRRSLEVRDVRSVEQTNYPLTVVAAPGAALALRISYDRRRFDATTITRMLRQLQTLLQGMAAQPTGRLADLPFLTVAERQQLLVDWNASTASYPQDVCLHHLFAAQVERTPDAVAVVFEEQQLTYHELQTQSDQLARYLRALGVGPEMRVGICLERSLHLIIGLLGVLKAGGAYVPLDPAYPKERLAFMLADSQVRVLVVKDEGRRTQDEGPTRASVFGPSSSAGMRVVDLRADWPTITRQPGISPAIALHPENLAYVIYTSGSTGQPKGALNTHRAIVNRLLWMQDAYRLATDDSVLQKTPYSFDVSVWEFFWPLISGARLVLAEPGGHQDSSYLVQLIADHQITTLHFVPSMLRVFLDEPDLRGCRSLRRVMCSGEPLVTDLQERFFARLDAQLHNLYGPTEAAVDVTFWACRRAGPPQPVPIGRPLANTQIYLLDASLQPVPVGAPGELFIGGVQLARGYLNRPALTAERFVPNPFSDCRLQIADCRLDQSAPDHQSSLTDGSVPQSAPERRWSMADGSVPQSAICNLQSAIGTRLYRTGDLARYRPDGNLEFIGRVDQQVKLRGVRIELGEIEAVLRRHPAVYEAVVLLREDSPNDRCLVAYVVPAEDERRTTNDDHRGTMVVAHRSSLVSELRGFLRSRLPDAMLPSAFVLLERLPRTSNGKLERRALPAPDPARPALDSAFIEPQTPDEEVLAAIWAQVLRLDQAGIDDNFFALGGDSMRSIQILARSREKGVHFSLQQLFQYPTIRTLAHACKAATGDATISLQSRPFCLLAEADQLRLPEGVEDAYPLVSLQAGMLFHTEYTADSAIYHDIFSFHLRALLNIPALEAAIGQLIARHAVLRTSFDLTRCSEPLQLVYRTVPAPLHVADLRQLAAAEQEAAIAAWQEAEKLRKFDWTHPPFLRFQVHLRSKETFQFTLSFHHAILDGWSVASLITELFQQYFLLLAETSLSAEPSPVATFRDFVGLEREILRSAAAQDYWTRHLSDASITRLPRRPSRASTPDTSPVRTLAVLIAPEISAGLKRLARMAAVPIKSVLLGAHLCVMRLFSGALDVISGLVINGRPETSDGERVLGLFLNTLPFRQRLPGGTWIELVEQTFAAEQALLPYRRYPLARLQQDFGGQALFETVFTFAHFHVYESLRGQKDLDLLGGSVFEQTNFPLSTTFSMNVRSAEIQLNLSYNTAELCDEQLKAMSGYYARVLAAMAEQPAGRYDALCLLSDAEQQQLLVEWNATQADYPRAACIHHLFAAQVADTPAAVAAIYRDQHITYQELNQRANLLAHYLQAFGVGPEVRVAVCMERSLELIVGLLGILKAGGAYVPLDPSYPHERLAFILEDSQAPILLTQQQLAGDLPASWALVVRIDADWEMIAQGRAENPAESATSDTLAYVIYTSGSTGRPKGVLVTHRNMVHSTHARITCYREPIASFLLLASVAFDSSVAGIFWTLCTGGTLVLPPAALLLDMSQLAGLFAQQHISHITSLPSLYALLLEQAGARQLNSLRTVIVAGETCAGALVQQHYAVLPQTLFFNEYGPTEGTVWSSVYQCRAQHADLPVPIGHPIRNTQIYLLDPYLQPVPLGVPGEIYIGGAGLTQGYLARPALTAEKFVPNPFATTNDATAARPVALGPASCVRLYRTGDLARYRPDGLIEFLGRVDQQVKLRGYRIELGEVETVLLHHRAVQEAVVLAREDIPGDMRLVAYVVPTSDEQRTTNDEERDPSSILRSASLASELRAFLHTHLPDYMVPTTFVLLDALPLTPNGKIDRRALPAAAQAGPAPASRYVAPRTPTEAALADIWADVLHVEQVGVHDDFFDLGGHSLLATQILFQTRKHFQLDLPLKMLLADGCTVAGLAEAIQERQIEQAAPEELAAMLEALDELSDEEIKGLLASESQ
jgi:amino acid adenylation domain-containing protein